MKRLIILFLLALSVVMLGQDEYYYHKKFGDRIAPGVPSNLLAVGTVGRVDLTWTDPPDPDLAMIVIFRENNGSTNPINKWDTVAAGAQSYAGWTSLEGYIVNYRLKAVDSSGNYSEFSVNVSDTVTVEHTNYYVSTVSAGDSSADSWTNKKRIELFDWSDANAGDTVYIDGGTDSLVYTSSIDSIEYLPKLYPGNGGSYLYKLMVTRGKDAGHNGEPIFDADSVGIPLFINEDYIEFSYLTFKNGELPTIYLNKNIGIDIFHCKIIHPYRHGISLLDSYNTRIMYNTITSGGHTDKDEETDAIVLSGANCEIAYNRIFEQNQNSNDHHQDLIQTHPGWGTSGTLKIHHNFFMQSPASEATHTNCVYITGSLGYYEIYNNIIVMNNAHDGNCIGVNKGTTAGYKMYAKIFNNTLIASNSILQVVHISNVDSLRYKNNIIYKPSGSSSIRLMGTTVDGYTDIDYNQYYTLDTSALAGVVLDVVQETLGWAEWKALGFDAHGEVGAISFLNAYGDSIHDYTFLEGSSGIDEGVDLSSIFTDDINLKTRTGSWDIGAIEGDTTEPVIPDYFSEDFSDGDYTTGNVWTAASGTFAVQDTFSNPLSANTYGLRCATAGIISVPCSLAYATWEFDIFKGADGNSISVGYIDDDASITNLGGYRFRYLNDESLTIMRTAAVTEYTTATSYLATSGTWYRVQITRTSDGVTTTKIKGGSFGTADWTEVVEASGANPFTDTNVISSAYFVLALGSGDRISNIRVYE